MEILCLLGPYPDAPGLCRAEARGQDFHLDLPVGQVPKHFLLLSQAH